MKKFFITPLIFCWWAIATALPAQAADWQRTVIFVYGETKPGQDMFVRGGIDHQYAKDHLTMDCSDSNFLCAIPIRYRNTLNPYTANWKKGDSMLDWYGLETGQKNTGQMTIAQGSAPDWTTDNRNNATQVATSGFGFTPLNTWGDHYWMLDVEMDCSKTVNGWFEVKSFISNSSGWENDIQQAGTPYASNNHFAKCGKINRFARNTNAAFFQDFAIADPAATSSANKVFFQVDRADGYINLFVNGVERMRFNNMQARFGEKIDITSLLWQGENTIKVVASAVYDTDGYAVKLWADNTLLLNDAQDRNFSQGIALDKSITLNVATALPRQTLSITSTANSEAAIYINNVFTGKFAPTEIQLAPGEYRLGIGESTSIQDTSSNSVTMTGQFREQDIVVSTQNIAIDSTQLPLLKHVNEHKVAVVPLMLLHSGLSNEQVVNSGLTVDAPSNNIGVLTADDITVAEKVIQLSGEKWIKPMSYGLTQWQITLLEPVTRKVYFTDHLRLEDNIQFSDDLSKYDLVIFIMPDRTRADAQGNRSGIISGFGGLGTRPNAFLPASWLDGPGRSLSERLASVVASSGMAHEALHVYGGYALNDYMGVANLHGAVFHGYDMHDLGFTPEWLDWQQKYIRGQVAEDSSTGLGIFNSQKPATPSLFSGLFNTLHSGLGIEQLWSYRKPISRIQQSAQDVCLDLGASDNANDRRLTATACNNAQQQRWSVRHAQNGAYSLVNDSTQQCLDSSQGNILQKACSYALSQRFLLNNLSNDSFTLTTLTGQCLALPSGQSSGTVTLESCNTAQISQAWRFN